MSSTVDNALNQQPRVSHTPAIALVPFGLSLSIFLAISFLLCAVGDFIPWLQNFHLLEALYPGVAPDRKLAAFVASFKEIVWSLDPSTFEVLYDVPGDPTVSVAKLPTAAMAKLLETARRVFDRAESDKIAARLAGGGDDPDGLTVLVRQRVRVEG